MSQISLLPASHKRSEIRHPEKRHRPDNPSGRKPSWIRVKAPVSKTHQETLNIVQTEGLVTVCQEAACPNIGECWQKKHATFMIMGEICTRACAFCNVRTGKPMPLNAGEPQQVARAVKRLNLRHVVITSVDRDDLDDGGAGHFRQVIEAVHDLMPETTVEILTPDFKGNPDALDIVLPAGPDVFNHNLETVPRLYPSIRPGARYFTSLQLLAEAKRRQPNIFTKSGLMVGLGESKQEILQVMDDLRAAGVDFLTIGQYLQPTIKHAKVEAYVPPEEFLEYERWARGKGFLMVSASPLTRSSYHADEDFAQLRKNRAKFLAEDNA